ncbi:MAG: Do family serine endopeptidase [Phenylobacterium sp.]
MFGAGMAAAAVVAGAGTQLPANDPGQPGAVVRTSAGASVFAPPPGAPMSFADIFEQVSPAVVSINVTSRADASTLRRIPGFENFPFDLKPDEPGDDEDEGGGSERTPQGQPKMPRQQSSGSGFFIRPDGYIVTNNHVVENAEEITVVLKDERELKAKVVGRDEGTDLAVIKVEGANFPYVNFENSARPRVGDWVITVGNPFGLGGTATSGIISAYGRALPGETFVDYIQIDAPINRGNSGGPTFDIYGRVIGVNTAIFSPTGGSVGIGFAIPSEIADGITRQLISGGKITRGYIGATIQDFSTEMAEAQGIPQTRGAIVSDLTPGGPSERAGLLAGDVVTSVNGHAVKSSSELTREVAKASAGDVLRLDVIRDGRRRTLEIRSGVRPAESELLASRDAPGSRTRPGTAPAPSVRRPEVLGMAIGPLDQSARQRHSIEPEVKGVVVESIDQASDAAERGLKRGDVIVRAGNRAVATPDDLAAEVNTARKAGRTSVLVGVYRDGRTLFLPLKVTG